MINYRLLRAISLLINSLRNCITSMDVVNIHCRIKVISLGYIRLNCGYWGISMNTIRHLLAMLLRPAVINAKKCTAGCLKLVTVMPVTAECAPCWKWKPLRIFTKAGNA
ncbi:Uncharacterised protein [Vibrio cholerae]|nr:Uncharacterised protein [Vibrio cholerae]